MICIEKIFLPKNLKFCGILSFNNQNEEDLKILWIKDIMIKIKSTVTVVCNERLVYYGRIPFSCSRMVYCILEHCSGMRERNTSGQFYCSVLSGVFLEHCSYHPKRK